MKFEYDGHRRTTDGGLVLVMESIGPDSVTKTVTFSAEDIEEFEGTLNDLIARHE